MTNYSQPDPKPGEESVYPGLIVDLVMHEYHEDDDTLLRSVIEDVSDRVARGKECYGTVLETFNGRDALADAYEEVLDAALYIKQARMEVVKDYSRLPGDPAVVLVELDSLLDDVFNTLFTLKQFLREKESFGSPTN